MTRVPDIHRKRVNWSLDLRTTQLVESYTKEHGGEDRFNADFLIQRGAEAVGHFLGPDDYRAIAERIELNLAKRIEDREAKRLGMKK